MGYKSHPQYPLSCATFPRSVCCARRWVPGDKRPARAPAYSFLPFKMPVQLELPKARARRKSH